MFGNIKIRKTFGALIKLIVFIGVCVALYIKLQDFSVQNVRDIHIGNWGYFITAILLMFINWGVELIKWSLITKPFRTNLDRLVLIRSLFSGIATGIVTPNRLGNFLGRMLYFKGKKRILAALGTLYGNLSQFIATLIFGSVGLYAVGDLLLTKDQLYLLKAAMVVIFCLSFFIYIVFAFGPRIFVFLYRKHRNTVEILQKQLHDISFILLILSVVRYIVFISQFGFLLLAFGADYSEDLIYALYLHFAITSILPSLIMGKLVIRETVALVILSPFIANNAIIIVSSLSLWIINLGIPSLIGLYFLMRKKIIDVT